MRSWKKPTDELIVKTLTSVKKEADRRYFFSRLNNPLWIKPLIERGFFKNPPGIRNLPNGYFQYPNWPELKYLANVSNEVPDEIVEVILSLPKTENPRIYDDILEIILGLKGEISTRLLPKVIEYIELGNPIFSHRFPELLSHWVNEEQYEAALSVAKEVIHFQPDPKTEEKRKRRKKSLGNSGVLLDPTPRFDMYEYQQILEEGVRPLAEKKPYLVACILIEATASMIKLCFLPEEIDTYRDNDHSEIWCRRLDHPDEGHQDSKGVLVRTLTYACEKVYEREPASIEALDQTLRKQQWDVFTRLRQHLYGKNPTEQTLPWIREFILEHEDYARWDHHYDFQRMIQKSCEYFGDRLMDNDERTRIFDLVLSGPSKGDFLEIIGEKFSEDAFQQRQRYFHRKQLRPFSKLLYGTYLSYLEELETENQDSPLSDNNYDSLGEIRCGSITHKSPSSIDDLSKMEDTELLDYINEWDNEHYDSDDSFVKIDISSLSDVFQSLFKNTIIVDESRLTFWMCQRNNIRRPIYISSMIQAMQELVAEKKWEKLDLWIEFCGWVLSHPDTEHIEGEIVPSVKSSNHPDWGNSRRAVVDFLETCMKEEVHAPINIREGGVGLLCLLCTQFDWRLDHNHPVILNYYDPLAEAINTTRGRALEVLVQFGYWAKRHNPDDTVPEIFEILDSRLNTDSEVPLTRPENVLLGLNYGRLYGLNKTWTVEKTGRIFPHDNLAVWSESFGRFVVYIHPSRWAFNTLETEFSFALDHLEDFGRKEHPREEPLNSLGKHLLDYYLWGFFPLKGGKSLLERFYEKTSDSPQVWAHLFNHLGYSLKGCETLDQEIYERVVAFFDWRLGKTEIQELQEFASWFDAECLEPSWRLDAYSKILDADQAKDMRLSIEPEALEKLLPEHIPQVVACFSRITDLMLRDQNINTYIRLDGAKQILKVGLNSEDPLIRNNAERARENLLRVGCFDFLAID